ncbi:HNH endonuclease [Pseudomonas syringae pv. actinidiae]|nr:HNH endonuclease [Pseudomonas syringae pv. actinidiae]
MQFTVTINQAKALEWGLNSQQALLFAFVYGCPSWAKPMKTDDGIFFALSKAKIVEELPLLTSKPDTAYRMLKALEEAGLIELRTECFRLTEKGCGWNPNRMGYVTAYQPAVLPPRRRTKKKPIPSDLRAQVFERDGYECLRCGCAARLRLRADHVIPESRGGEASMANLQTLCMSCNSWKGVQTIDFRASSGGAA